MKLFVWGQPYNVPFGSSMYFAVAETVEQAREMARTAPAFAYTSIEENPPPAVLLGEPTRVLDLPCAEWHVWSE
jgi:hypothetical protein